jgi:cobalt-zinc-cadmium efflux system outer membrane protein
MKRQIESRKMRLLPAAARGSRSTLLVFAFALLFLPGSAISQTVSFTKYLDPAGRTVDAVIAFALENNAELAAMRSEAEAAGARIAQARLRPNPTSEISATRQLGGMDNSLMIQGRLPLELGGRRDARILAAERELDIRRLAVAERERLLIADVRSKFGESLAAVFKLKHTEEALAAAAGSYDLVSALASEGRRSQLERNMESVELSRIRAARETNEGTVEIRLLELRNLAGMAPESPLILSGDFSSLSESQPPRAELVQRALQLRPDLQGARALEQLAAAQTAQTEQARADGRIDADVMVGYQRMRSGFPLSGFDEAGRLQSIESRFQFLTFGVMLDIPFRNRNQGMVAAAVFEAEAARRRRELLELTVRSEVASAYVRYERAARALEIYQVGVREQSAANLNTVRQAYELGSRTLLDYISEQRRFAETESGLVDAQLELYLAGVDVSRAAPEEER